MGSLLKKTSEVVNSQSSKLLSCLTKGHFLYSFGLKEHIVFPEINFDKVDRIRGMDVTIVTTGQNKEVTYALLKAFNFPFIETQTDRKKH